jgi:hypothetical protein
MNFSFASPNLFQSHPEDRDSEFRRHFQSRSEPVFSTFQVRSQYIMYFYLVSEDYDEMAGSIFVAFLIIFF